MARFVEIVFLKLGEKVEVSLLLHFEDLEVWVVRIREAKERMERIHPCFLTLERENVPRHRRFKLVKIKKAATYLRGNLFFTKRPQAILD